MPRTALLVVTGVRCHYFDSIGVPTPEAMISEYGGGEPWQRAMTERWVRRLADETAAP
jgi:hypothetical protein